MRQLLTVLVLLLLGATALQAQTDTDGDGLPDTWETEGVKDSTGRVILDLPKMGAKVDHKDIFVELDFMVAEDHTHEPKSEALQRVIDAFTNAPVANPDGTNGIRIHLDAGPQSLMIPGTTTTWGNLSGANNFTHQDEFADRNSNGGTDFSEVDRVKAANFSPSRRGVFHYGVCVHKIRGQGNASGWARGIPSDDFIVSLGGWSGQEGTVPQQAGTIMHELGHCLGLRHGGVDHVHRKPNFLSIMNYDFQTRGLRINGRYGTFDFSRAQAEDLDENNLDEEKGVVGPEPQLGTSWYVNGVWWAANRANGRIDWNKDGRIETSVTQDLNNDKLTAVLRSFDDWSNIQYAAFGVAARAEEETLDDEMDQAEDDEIPLDYRVITDLDDVAFVADPGAIIPLKLTVINDGVLPDTYTLRTESRWVQLPPSFPLQPGEQRTFDLTVKVPDNAQPGTLEDIELEAASSANPLVIDSASTEVTVAGAIPNVGSPVASEGGGFGCFIATAAYGSYLDPHVVTLRGFRDNYLLSNPVGRPLVRLYYRLSPPLARQVQRSDTLRFVTLATLTPVVFSLEHPLVALLGLTLAGYGFRRRRPPAQPAAARNRWMQL